ncbi:zinc ribbon domain-containing protein [Blautia wexlerae]|nr:zinc ribbon domain-containing protein [Blautia wexlerae]
MLAQRAAEKGNGTNTSRYQNRYALSGRIRCGECGTTFKRRSHYKPSGDYIAWTCGKHIENRHACSMLYVEETAIHDAFVTMINKLVFGHQKILKPLLESLKSTDDKDKLNMIRRIDQEIENTAMQKQTLVGLATQGILEPAIYNEECSALAIEEEKTSC